MSRSSRQKQKQCIQKCLVDGCNGKGNLNGISKTHRSSNACPNKSRKKTISPVTDVEPIVTQTHIKHLETKLRQTEEELRRLNNVKIFCVNSDDLQKEIVQLTERYLMILLVYLFKKYLLWTFQQLEQ